MSAAHTRVYRNGVLEAENFPVNEVSEYLAQPDTVVWVDLCGPSIEQVHELSAELGLHELAVEDALSAHQRPKLDHYESHLFLSSHAVRVDTEHSRLDETEIDSFISDRWLITVRKERGLPARAGPDTLGSVRRSRQVRRQLPPVRTARPHRRRATSRTVQCFDDYYDEVSEGIFSEQPLEPGAAASLVPDAPGARAVPPPGRGRCARRSAR